MTVDVSMLKDAVTQWVDQGAGVALDTFGQELRGRAPIGTEPSSDGTTIVDSLEMIITSEGEQWSGELNFTSPHASYSDEGTEPHDIQGNPLLAFQWQGSLVIVHSVHHPGTPRTGWFTDNVTDDAWTQQVSDALDTIGSPA